MYLIERLLSNVLQVDQDQEPPKNPAQNRANRKRDAEQPARAGEKKGQKNRFCFLCGKNTTHILDINKSFCVEEHSYSVCQRNFVSFLISQVEEPEAVRNFKQMMEKMLGR